MRLSEFLLKFTLDAKVLMHCTAKNMSLLFFSLPCIIKMCWGEKRNTSQYAIYNLIGHETAAFKITRQLNHHVKHLQQKQNIIGFFLLD